MTKRPKTVWLLALALPLLFTAACPPPWVFRERHQERHERRDDRGERRERYGDRDERRDDHNERRERRGDREERRERWD